MEETFAENIDVHVETNCLVCSSRVQVPQKLQNTAIICENCSLSGVPGGVIKYLIRTEFEQREVRAQGREACIINATAADKGGDMPLRNPYEFQTENWHLWKDGYLEELKSRLE